MRILAVLLIMLGGCSYPGLRERLREAETRAAEAESWKREAAKWKSEFERELDRRDELEMRVWEAERRELVNQ